MKNKKVVVPKTRILLVDDHPVVRHALKLLIDHEPNLTVCGEAENAKAALQQIASNAPDFIIMDLALPDMSGIELIKKIRAQALAMPILVVSMQGSGYDKQVLQAGGNGCVSKAEAAEKVIPAIQKILARDIDFDQQ